MSELATANNHTDNRADRRRDFRRPVCRTAELVPAGNQAGINCTILDESDGGVQIETAQPLDLPEQILIKFSDQASQLVRRCWANGTRAGYQYIEIVPAKRNRPADELPAGQTDLAALNEFIRIAGILLDLSDANMDWSHQAKKMNAILAELPHARLQLSQRGTAGGQVVQLFAIPQASQSAPSPLG